MFHSNPLLAQRVAQKSSAISLKEKLDEQLAQGEELGALALGTADRSFGPLFRAIIAR